MSRPPSQLFANDLSQEALALFALVTDRHQRNHLRGFLGFLSKTGRNLTEVSDDALEAYEKELDLHGVGRAHQLARNVAAGWAKMQDVSPDWPQCSLAMPDIRRMPSADSMDLRASLRADIACYLDRASGDDLFSGGTETPLAPATRIDKRRKIFRLVTIALETGVPLDGLSSLADLVGHYEPILRHLWKGCARKRNAYAAQLARVLRLIAEHWTQAGTETLEAILTAERRMRPRKAGLTDRNRARLRQFTVEKNLTALLRLPGVLAARLDTSAPTISDALSLQSALAIAILFHAPMRVKNLAALDINRHFDWTEMDRCYIAIPAEEVKNDEDLQFHLPAHLGRMIRLYLDVYRPLLLKGKNTNALFVSLNGRQKLPNALGVQLPKLIREETGLDMNVHLFRHLAGFIFLRNNPGQYEPVRQLLGHKSISTTVAFYTGLEVAETFRRYDAILERMRHPTKVGADV